MSAPLSGLYNAHTFKQVQLRVVTLGSSRLSVPTEVERHPVQHPIASCDASELELDKLVGDHIGHTAVLHADALWLARRT